MSGPCMCGDPYCGSCGPAQGNTRCPNCGAWSADGGCADPKACEAANKQADLDMMRDEVEIDIQESRYAGRKPSDWAKKEAIFVYSDDERGFWSNIDGWGNRSTATVFVKADRDSMNLPVGGRWVGWEEAISLTDDPDECE